jgi:hypothetical protein
MTGCERYFHHTPWSLDEVSLPADFSTGSWIESHYWTTKMAEAHVADPALDEVLRQIFSRASAIPYESAVPAIRQLVSARLSIPIEDVTRLFPDERPSDLSKVSDEFLKLQASATKAKELLFEEVRVQDFPSLPSRRSAIFLFPSTEEPVSFMERMKFVAADRTVVEIEPLPTARIHRADANQLNCNGLSRTEQKRDAALYWQGSVTREPVIEVLLDGPFRIVRIIRARSTLGAG